MCADLLAEYGGGTPSDTPNDVNNTKHRRAIQFPTSEVARVAGLDTDVNTISKILTDIGCTVAGGGNGEFSVAAPTWRPDINEPCRSGRGSARDWSDTTRFRYVCPPAPVKGKVGLTADQLRRRRVADELAEYGLVEALSYPFVGDEDYKAFG